MPVTPYSLNAHAIELIKKHKLDEGENLLWEALKIYSFYVPAMKNLAYIEIQRKNFKKAEKIYKKILFIQPRTSEVNFYLGLMYDAWGKHKKALEHYRAELRLNPTHKGAKKKLESK